MKLDNEMQLLSSFTFNLLQISCRIKIIIIDVINSKIYITFNL